MGRGKLHPRGQAGAVRRSIAEPAAVDTEPVPMKVVLGRSIAFALQTLDEDERRNVSAWIDHLKNWKTDVVVRERSHKLDLPGDVYVLHTSTDMRIFFTPHMDKGEVEILDLATKATIMLFANGSRPPRP